MSATADVHGLPLRTRLGEFEIIDRLGQGGFSIVYLARDQSLEREVALKEYMPSAVATRAETSHVYPRSEEHREMFEIGLRSFINEGKLLAQFDHPALVKVHRAWEANGTAYMVMPRYRGLTLKQTVQSLPGPPDEAWLLDLLAPLTAALSVIHAQSCFHRDIAPDNILVLEENGQPVLLDFGAARRVIEGMTDSPTAMLKPGYAPVEQYNMIPGLKQGPWTDVYALGATIHWVITGKPPPDSGGRSLHDTLVPLEQVAEGRYSRSFLQAVDRALAVLPDNRTRSIEDFCRDLGLRQADPLKGAPARWVDPDATLVRDAKAAGPRRPLPPAPAPIEAGPSGAASDHPTVVKPPASLDRTAQPKAADPVAVVSKPRAWRTGLIAAALALALLTAAFIAWWFLDTRPGPAMPAGEGATQGPVPGVPPQEVPRPAPEPRAAPEPPAAEPPPPVVEPPPPAPAPVAPPSSDGQAVGPAASPPPEPARPSPPVPATPPRREVPRDAPAGASTRSAEPRPSSGPPRSPAQVERQRPPTGDQAECARLMTQLSLGDSNPALIERLRTLRCS